jgi:NAD(P)-dependent dehydrogenase (short-subunit alcohol dehydrogenase family)
LNYNYYNHDDHELSTVEPCRYRIVPAPNAALRPDLPRRVERKSDDMSRFSSRTALVTGSAVGIGAATAHLLAAQGARVVVADLNSDGAHEVAEAIRTAGGEATAVAVDLEHDASIRDMCDAAQRAYGTVDVLHNNAAASGAATIGRDGTIIDMDIEVWDRTMAVNVRAGMLTCKYLLPGMLAKGKGAIVNTSSNSALAGDLSLVAYGSSKGAVNSLTKYIATMYGAAGIRCNAVSPGPILTPSLASNLTDEARTILLANSLTGKLGEPEDVAQLVAFLASDDAAYINGEVIRVDGGMLTHSTTYAQFMGMAAG